jgi:hypothetical protein
MPTTLHPPRTPTPRRELVLPFVSVALTAGLPLAFRDRLPDPVAVHWGIDGSPDGSASFAFDVVSMAVLVALIAVAPVWAAGRAERRAAQLLVGVSHGAAAMFVALRWQMLVANADAATWQDAASITGIDLLILLPVTLVAGAFGWWLARTRPERPSARIAPPVLELPPDHALVWVGSQAWGPARLVGPLVLVVGAVLLALQRSAEALVAGPAFLFIGLALWTAASITVSVGPAGLKVRFGPFGWPVVRVAVADVTSVHVEDVEPLSYGGWGYRVMPGVRAVIVRRGPALRVGRAGRSDLIVTVDDAATAAAVLAAHRAAGHDGGDGGGGDGGGAAPLG